MKFEDHTRITLYFKYFIIILTKANEMPLPGLGRVTTGYLAIQRELFLHSRKPPHWLPYNYMWRRQAWKRLNFFAWSNAEKYTTEGP